VLLEVATKQQQVVTGDRASTSRDGGCSSKQWSKPVSGSTQHRAPDCDQPKNPNPLCWKCEKPGHQSKECPEKQSNGTGQGGGAGSGAGGGGASGGAGGGGAGRTQRVGIMMPAPRTEELPDLSI